MAKRANMRNGMTKERAIRRWLWAACAGLLLVVCVAEVARAADDPLVLQQRAVDRIEAFIDHFRKTGDFRSRIADLRQAEAEIAASNAVLTVRGDWVGVAHGFVRLGQIARMQSNWDAAAAHYRKAEAAAQRARDPVLQARALTGFAQAEVSRRNLGAAAGYASKAIPLAETGGDRKYLFDALDIVGQIQIAQGDLSAAAETLNRALAVANEIHDESRLFYGYLDHADAYLKRAERCDYERDFTVCLEAVGLARTDYTEALRLARQLGYVGLAAMTESFLQDIDLREQLIHSRAESHRLVSETGVFAPKVAKDVLVTERFAPEAGTIPAALEALYRKSNAERAQAGGFASTSLARNWFIDGLMQQFRGENGSALASFLEAVQFLERDRGKLRDERDRGTFFEDKVEFYHAAILQLLERGRHAEAFELMERSRSRVMSDLIASRSLGLSRPEDRALYAESLRLRSEIATRQGSLLTLATDPKAGAERAQLAQESGKLESQYEILLARIAREAPRVGELLDSQPVSLSALQQSMRREGYEALEYLVLEHAVILWHISADAVHVRNVFLPRSQLMEKVKKLGDNLSLSDRGTLPFDERTARELFLFLVQPAKEWIKSDRLVVIPHEDLNYLPFQALLDPADGRYLGEGYAISVAPSVTVLLALKRAAPTAGASALAVADPGLVAGQDEAQAVAQLYAPRSKLVVDPLAREADLKRWAGEYDVLHLSVHGKFKESEPLLSYLKLARGGADDGELTAAEMFGLPLAHSRLVVLSACETGKDRATHANELLGMQRALLYAGASTLVLSYWPVDSDATAAFMQAFHRAAQSTAPPAAAREALKAVKANPAYAHPYHWAAFMVVGR